MKPGESGVDAAGTQEHQALNTGSPGFMHDIRLDHQVLVNELCGIGIVGVYTPHHGCGQIDVGWSFILEKRTHIRLAGQIEFGVGACNDLDTTLLLKHTHDGRTDHAAVAGHINPRCPDC